MPELPNADRAIIPIEKIRDQMNLLDIVALTQDLPEHGLFRGQVGTIVETLGENAFEVEFASADGVPYAMLGIEAEKLMLLRHERVA